MLRWHYVSTARHSHIIVGLGLRICRGPLELDIPPIVIPLLTPHWR